MEPLDLSKRPPRSPRERLDDLVMMPRTIDKLRAKLPGGNTGSYKIAGFSEYVLKTIGVTEAELLEVVRAAKSDDDVAAWLRAHADMDKYAQVNEHFENYTFDRVKDQAGFDERYPVRRRLNLSHMFDILDADDREMFA